MRVRYRRKIIGRRGLLFIYAVGCIIGAVCGAPFLGVWELTSFYIEYGQVKIIADSSVSEVVSHFLMTDEEGHTEYESYVIPEIAKESDIPYEVIMGSASDSGAEAGEDQGGASDSTFSGVSTEATADTGISQAPAISLEKLADFDYLIQNFYQVDNTTTITSDELNAAELLSKDMTLQHDSSSPQILIYHTHSQEGYVDSVEGDTTTTVVGVGEELARILTDEYGFSVIHHTGEYDVDDRDHAYSNAAPAIEQLLADNPGIEVVIDLHRDGVNENTRLVTEIDGSRMAQIMFFNGLSRTTWAGDIDYLYNPYIEDNMAFSLQMQLKAAEMFPGFTRKIYLKGYRYNMHYCPKTLLVEVGAQTNTFEEAKNAMAPLAKLLNEVLRG